MQFHVDRHRNIPEAFFAAAERSPDLPVYVHAVAQRDLTQEDAGARTLVTRTFRDVEKRVAAVARCLEQWISPRSEDEQREPYGRPRIAILSNTRPEWMEADIAILSARAITVAVYHSLSDEEVAYILFDSGAEIIFVENTEQASKLLRIMEREWEFPGTEDRPALTTRLQFRKIVAFETVSRHPLIEQWEDIVGTVGQDEREEKLSRLDELKPGDLATLVYTSGTTGPPKGVMQTHQNHLSNIRQVYQAGIIREGSTVFLFLPLAHSFARLMGMIGFLTPVVVYFPAVFSADHSKLEPRSLLRDMREMGANVVPIVPRFLEKMEEALRSRAERSSISGRLLRLALWAAESSYEDRIAARAPGRAKSMLFRSTAPVRKSIRESLFGTSFTFAVSGGAKLPLAIANFFQALEIPVLEGYGLTETCVATNFNPLGKNKIGTVGPVLAKDIEQRIEEDGEICFRGPNVSLGYWKRPTATRASWDQAGWFHTGDLGTIDEDGYLTINGRKKDLIVTSGGKKVAPQAIEDELRYHPLISQAVLLGEGRPFCVALFTLKTKPAAEKLDEVKSQIRAHVDAINAHLASFETVKNFHILDEDFTVENGFLTPTMKVKRKLVAERHAKELEELYRTTKKPREE